MTLLSPPIPGRSLEVKLASQKWRQLQNKISQRIASSTKVINLDTALLGVSDSSKNGLPESPAVTPEENKKVQQKENHLPILSGILRNTDIYGRVYATAVIDGQRLKENDKTQGFRIKKILEDGVVVTNSGKQWFLSAPDVSYSRIHASGNENKDSK
jgi:hypothetical protein